MDAAAVCQHGLASSGQCSIAGAVGNDEHLEQRQSRDHQLQLAGVGRESLYRALSADGNPELGTVLKVVRALGLRLHASPVNAPTK
jgi:probable addiction module antidote protein